MGEEDFHHNHEHPKAFTKGSVEEGRDRGDQKDQGRRQEAKMQIADEVGKMTEAGDLLPSPFPNFPLPRFVREKPEVIARVKEMFG